MKRIILGVVLLSLAGCTTVPVSSLLKLRKLDFLTADAEHIQVAVRMPDTVQVSKDGAVLEIGGERKEPATSIRERFVLEKMAAPAIPQTLKTEEKPGFHLEVFRIAPAGMERLETLRAQIKRWKQQNPNDAKGSLSIGVSGCRPGALPNGPLKVSTYLRVEKDAEFIMMTKERDLRTFVREAGKSLELLPCSTVHVPQ